MPRIGGGGGGRVPPPPSGADAPRKTDFASQLKAPTQGTDAARTEQARQTVKAQLTGKAREIAKRLEAGELDDREATRAFVGLVIEERLPHFRKRKKKKGGSEASPEEQLEEAVAELIEEDPVLAQRLSRQLAKLASEG